MLVASIRCESTAYQQLTVSGNLKNWEFTEHGLMAWRFASINDLVITQADRKFHWPLGRRPDDHAGLGTMGL